VLAKIGTEILDLQDVKPGDFAQTRAVGAPDGHAFQIHACTCEGECLIGPSGSPKLLKDLGGEVIATPEGQWYAKASFKIDGATSPLYVGMHTVLNSDWLESNLASKMEDKNDKDGGVQVRHGAAFEDPTKKGAKRTYVGRLSSSSWAGYVRGNAPLKRPGSEPAVAAPQAPAAAAPAAPTASTAPAPAAAPAAPATPDGDAVAVPVATDPKRLSGAHWVAQFPTSRSTSDLAAPFKDNAEAFIAAIEAAGGEVDIAATLRPPQRAYLMHWAWMIGKLAADPTTVPAQAGVDIVWDHGDNAASVAAAKAMIAGYQLVHKPSLGSRHIKGKAIDMDITGIVGKTMKTRKAAMSRLRPCRSSTPSAPATVCASSSATRRTGRIPGAEALRALLLALATAGCSHAALAGEAIVRWDGEGKAWLYTTAASAPAGTVQAQYPGAGGKARCCAALKAVGNGTRGEGPRASDQVRTEKVWMYATERAAGAAGAVVVAPDAGPFVGAAVFGTDAVLHQRTPTELSLGESEPAPQLLTCVTQEGLHLLKEEGGAKRTHLYLPFGYEVKPTCSKRAMALVKGS
jgi:hypothetical protein